MSEKCPHDPTIFEVSGPASMTYYFCPECGMKVKPGQPHPPGEYDGEERVGTFVRFHTDDEAKP